MARPGIPVIGGAGPRFASSRHARRGTHILPTPAATSGEAVVRRWYPFPKGRHVEALIAEAALAYASRHVFVPRDCEARLLCAHGIILDTTSYIHPGTLFKVPLDTIDGECMLQTGSVVACHMVTARRHRTEVHFGVPLDPAHFVVCGDMVLCEEGSDTSRAVTRSQSQFRAGSPEQQEAEEARRCMLRRCAALGEALAVAASAASSNERLEQISARINRCLSQLRKAD